MIETLSSESISEIAELYRRRGYEIVPEPDPKRLPAAAKSLHPEFLAVKDNEKVIVEVKYSQNLLAYPALTRLAEVIRRTPGWRLDVVILESPHSPVEPRRLSIEDATRRLETADRVARETEDYAAALLLLWTAIEAVLREQLIKQSDDAFVSTSRLAKVAYSLGLINEQDVPTAEWMAGIRNQVVHGASESSVSKVDYVRAHDFATRLIQTNGNVETL